MSAHFNLYCIADKPFLLPSPCIGHSYTITLQCSLDPKRTLLITLCYPAQYHQPIALSSCTSFPSLSSCTLLIALSSLHQFPTPPCSASRPPLQHMSCRTVCANDAPALSHALCAHVYGWPEPYIYSVHDRIFGDFPAKDTVHTLYIYGLGQP